LSILIKFYFLYRVLQDLKEIEVGIFIFWLKINKTIVSSIKVYLVYQEQHVQHVFRANEEIKVLQVHPVFQGKKENQ
jgi:hypothetical protein